MTSESIIEAHAKRLCARDQSLNHGGWSCYVDQAKEDITAFLKAIEEPSEGMIEAYWHSVETDKTPLADLPLTAKRRWQIMLATLAKSIEEGS